MPRPRKPGDETKEVKKRSRNGCWPCKARKVKCGEEKPACSTCIRQGETCDYSIRLNWEGRSKKREFGVGQGVMSLATSPPQTASSPANIDAQYARPSPQIGFVTPSHPGGDLFVQPQTSPSHSRSASFETSLPPIVQFSPGLMPPVPVVNHPALSASPVLKNPTWSDHAGNSPNNTLPVRAVPLPRPTPPPNSYPSPAESGLGSPGITSNPFNFNPHVNQMLPPMSSSSHNSYNESVRSPFNGAKRMKLSPRADAFPRDSASIPRSTSQEEVARLNGFPTTPNGIQSLFGNPLTPAASAAENNDDRRISVSSLLSDSNSDERRSSSTTTNEQLSRQGSLFRTSLSYSDSSVYGHDKGNPDLDMPRNDDYLAINGASPSESSDFESWLSSTDLGIKEFAFGQASRATAFGRGGYYATPVPVKIPSKLEPLPATLVNNPMNLLYFHHFLNHTARILVPHDCAENPFKTVLPQMAVKDSNLLNLLLAYSACHRARLLGHPEPKNRIAYWVRDLFTHLMSTFNSADEQVSNANLATAIMMASLEIISPSSFGVEVPWQQHLNVARDIIKSRLRPHSVSRRDAVMYFLTRWMAYLDVIGSLSGRKAEAPLFAGNYWTSTHAHGVTGQDLSLVNEHADDDDDYTIDCLMGFTTRCVTILAEVACLAHECTEQRLDLVSGQVNESWRPSADVVTRANKLRADLEYARNHEQRQCFNHNHSASKGNILRRPSYIELSDKDIEESLASNDAFHWAGQVHLLRRVYNLPASHPDVQKAVHELVKLLRTIREGGSAMNNILFPMFTAGVEATDKLDRAEILSRIKSAEDLGMFQMIRARKIMEQVWRTGTNWELLVNGEFFG